MMSISLFLAELKIAGITLAVSGDKLNIKSRVSPIPSELVSELKERKLEIIKFLQNQRQPVSPIDKIDSETIVDATSTQQRLWLIESDGAKGAYNIAQGYRFKGKLDTACFRQSVALVIASHDVFQLKFLQQDGVLKQTVRPDARPKEMDCGSLNECDMQAKLAEYAVRPAPARYAKPRCQR